MKGWGTPPGLSTGSDKKSNNQIVEEWVNERRADIFGHELILIHAWKWCGIRLEEVWNMNLGLLLQMLSLYRP